jgi:hypothetical protein
MLSIVLLMVGMGFLGQRRGQYEAARDYIEQVQAEAVAESGLQDALGKLAKDIGFPPLSSQDQSEFVYSEVLRDADGDQVGVYRVTITVRYAIGPYRVVRIHSLGLLGEQRNPRATCTKLAEVDIDPNRTPFQVLFVTTNEN